MQVSKPTEDDSNDVTDDTTDEAGEASEHEASKHWAVALTVQSRSRPEPNF